MAASLPTILNWFLTGKKPTQAQFWEAWQSYWHKDDVIPMSKIQNLANILAGKADKTQFDLHAGDENAHNITTRLAGKAPLEHTHSTDDIDGLTELLEDINTGPATATEYGGVMLGGDLAGPANAPTVPGKLNKGANPEFEYLADTSGKYGLTLWSRVGAMFRSMSLLWDEVEKTLTIAGSQAIWEAYHLVTDGNMGIKVLALANTAFKLFDNFGDFLSVGTTNAGKRVMRIYVALRLYNTQATANNETEFVGSIVSNGVAEIVLKTFTVPNDAVLNISVRGINIQNIDEKYIQGDAFFCVKNNDGVLTNSSITDFNKQWSTIKEPAAYTAGTDARVDISIAADVVSLKYLNVGGKLTNVQCEVKHSISNKPEA